MTINMCYNTDRANYMPVKSELLYHKADNLGLLICPE